MTVAPDARARTDDAVSPLASSLPTDGVTFLLTDIEGSTRAGQAAPEAMTAPVARHYEILDSAIAVHGGMRPQEQGEGDSGRFLGPCQKAQGGAILIIHAGAEQQAPSHEGNVSRYPAPFAAEIITRVLTSVFERCFAPGFCNTCSARKVSWSGRAGASREGLQDSI